MESTDSFQRHIMSRDYPFTLFEVEEDENVTEETALSLGSFDQKTFNKALKCFSEILGEGSINSDTFNKVKSEAVKILSKEKDSFLKQKNKLQVNAIKRYKWNHGFIPCAGGICFLSLGIGPMATAFLVDEGAKAVFAAIVGYSFICIGVVSLLYGCVTFTTLGCRTSPPLEEKLFSQDYESIKLCCQIKKINQLIACINSDEFRNHFFGV